MASEREAVRRKTVAIARAITAMLALWPPYKERGIRFLRGKPQQQQRDAPVLQSHWWSYHSAEGSMCTQCLA